MTVESTEAALVQLASDPERIAVIQTAFLGDVVFTSPLVRALKLGFPSCQLTMVTTPKAAPLAACIPGVDRVVSFDKRGGDAGFGMRRVAREMEKPDVVLVPHPSMRSALLARMSGAKERIGFRAKATAWLFTTAVPARPREPYAHRFLDLARALGIEAPAELTLRAPPEALIRADALLGKQRSVGLAIGSEWETKRWPPEHMAALADRLLEAGLRPVLLGGPKEAALAQAVRAAMKVGDPLDLVGNDLVEAVGVIARLKGIVGGDTGLVHIGRALGTPTLLLFGPTDPGVHQLEHHAQAIRLGLDCQPCHPHGPRRCPLGHHACMRDLGVERVWGSLQNLLSRVVAA